MRIFVFLWLVIIASVACSQEAILLQEDFEQNSDINVQMKSANQPYETHAMELTTEKAHSDVYSVKIDFTGRHQIDVYLAPRTTAKPGVNWGALDAPGDFYLPPLDFPLLRDRGYLLSLFVLVERAEIHAPIGFEVEIVGDTPFGPVRTQIYLDTTFTAPTNGWVKVEVELASFLFEKMEAAGAKVDGLRLSAISIQSFINGQSRITAYVDDLTLREVPLSVVEEHRQANQEQILAKRQDFKPIPTAENTFVWGMYGNLCEPGMSAYHPLPTDRDQRLQQMEWLQDSADWLLLDVRRHYGNTIIQGGGMLFPRAMQSSYDYVKMSLDKCAEYGVLFSPSTYLTQHYDTGASREECQAAMSKLADLVKDHPALLAYWLVDEPSGATLDDFLWGKGAMEAIDPEHPCLSACNSINAISQIAPLVRLTCIDYYPLNPVMKDDKGAWAVADSVKYARTLGTKRIWVLPQAFGESSFRAPTVPEFGIQIFGALAEGASGFIPYAYSQGMPWLGKYGEYGNLVDPFGNPTPLWEAMKDWGPYLCSVGPLLIGADRLPEDSVTAQVGGAPVSVVSNVGRSRPLVVARLFNDPIRNVRYVVVYNNTLLYRHQPYVAISQFAPEEQALDLFGLRGVPRQGNSFFAGQLLPGEGRIFTLGTPAALASIKSEVAINRVNLELDLLRLEEKTGTRMGLDLATLNATIVRAEQQCNTGDYTQALTTALSGFDVLQTQQHENDIYRTVNDRLECSRLALGHVHAILCRRVGSDAYAKDATEVVAIRERTLTLADRFFSLQGRFYREGPQAIVDDITPLLKDVEALERDATVFFGW